MTLCLPRLPARSVLNSDSQPSAFSKQRSRRVRRLRRIPRKRAELLQGAPAKARKGGQRLSKSSRQSGTLCDVLCDVTTLESLNVPELAVWAVLSTDGCQTTMNTGLNATHANCCYCWLLNLGARGPRFESARPDNFPRLGCAAAQPGSASRSWIGKVPGSNPGAPTRSRAISSQLSVLSFQLPLSSFQLLGVLSKAQRDPVGQSRRAGRP